MVRQWVLRSRHRVSAVFILEPERQFLGSLTGRRRPDVAERPDRVDTHLGVRIVELLGHNRHG